MEVLVCVHGLAGSSRWWRPALDRLRQTREVMLVDLPRRLRPETASQWLAERVEEHGGKVDLAAHSLGAVAAAQVAAGRPDLVRRLVLVSPVGVPARRRLPAYAPALAVAVARARPSFVPVLALDALRAGPLNLVRGGLYAISADIRGELGKVAAPTLLVWGERDGLVPLRLAEEWTRAVPAARLVRLEAAGHVPMFDAPAALAAAITEFLDEPRDFARM